VQAMKRKEKGAMGNGSGADSGIDWKVVDNDGLQRIANVSTLFLSRPYLRSFILYFIDSHGRATRPCIYYQNAAR
jgi:hypothetical protein